MEPCAHCNMMLALHEPLVGATNTGINDDFSHIRCWGYLRLLASGCNVATQHRILSYVTSSGKTWPDMALFQKIPLA